MAASHTAREAARVRISPEGRLRRRTARVLPVPVSVFLSDRNGGVANREVLQRSNMYVTAVQIAEFLIMVIIIMSLPKLVTS